MSTKRWWRDEDPAGAGGHDHGSRPADGALVEFVSETTEKPVQVPIVHSAKAGADVALAARRMLVHRIRLPVVEGESTIGMISSGDLLAAEAHPPRSSTRRAKTGQRAGS